ncbi:hypothetical protein AAV94_03860 [Lampropedia cohaerens]|uniref:Peptidase C-terminal archaeal/bacterial domain-containing protein n=1 Tax=Lampropedia cohaerens TaxID=1610491 RepID=A0A0U1Q1M5_9BURK|nr:PPC domain-containing protein [Lampropedia cohaerens]KKW68669.1 hypothetical protein AAV94_03860 [Lampropedia cohaerens]
MKSPSLIALCALALATLAGCNTTMPDPSASVAPAQAVATQTLVPEALQRGEITSASLVNVVDGSRSQVYRVALTQGDRIALQAQGALKSRLSVLRDGHLLAASQISGNGNRCDGDTDGTQHRSRLVFEADKTATFDVAVSGIDRYAYGPFELSITKLDEVDRADTALQPGQTYEQFGAGEARHHALHIADAGLYTIALTSCYFDGYLTLTGSGVSISDDDSGGDYNPAITAWLEPGQYTLEASALDTFAGHPYTLQVTALPIPPGASFQQGGMLVPGRTVSGVLHANSELDYQFTLARPTRVTITGRSDNFDVFLSVRDASASNHWEDDDSGKGASGTDAQITQQLPAGTYTVHVSAADWNSGLFTLQLETDGRSL